MARPGQQDCEERKMMRTRPCTFVLLALAAGAIAGGLEELPRNRWAELPGLVTWE